MIHIPSDKHIGLLFQPRSGSHVLRFFLSAATGRTNLNECFNHYLSTKSNRIIPAGDQFLVGNFNEPILLTPDQMYQRSVDHMRSLSLMSEKRAYTIFSILPRSFSKEYPQLNNMLASRDDIFFIRLERADVLYSILSRIVCLQNDVWHNDVLRNDAKMLPRIHRKYVFPIDELETELYDYIKTSNTISENYTAPVLYYEQFQSSPASLRKLFDGIPQLILSSPVNKFAGNYKVQVENLSEVEEFYEQFVNDNAECFPQYFGKLPHIQIPLSQGRQPRDLSLLAA